MATGERVRKPKERPNRSSTLDGRVEAGLIAPGLLAVSGRTKRVDDPPPPLLNTHAITH